MQEKRGTQKGVKKIREKGGKPKTIPEVLDAVEEHSLLERHLRIKEKYVGYIVNKHIY